MFADSLTHLATGVTSGTSIQLRSARPLVVTRYMRGDSQGMTLADEVFGVVELVCRDTLAPTTRRVRQQFERRVALGGALMVGKLCVDAMTLQSESGLGRP